MKTDRLFEIVYLLLRDQTMTAKRLAEHFEVSLRTIYRDIDTLSASGVPVYAQSGRAGGIRLMEDFVLDRSFLTEKEKASILIGIQSMEAAQYPDSGEILRKLGVLFQKEKKDYIEVDFSHWGSDKKRQKELFHNLKNAILEKQTVKFDYYNSYGEHVRREVRPFKLLYKDKAWYLYGYCLLKRNIRLFKITRIKKMIMTGRHFTEDYEVEEKGEAPLFHCENLVAVSLSFAPSCAYRAYDIADETEIKRDDEGKITARIVVPEDEWLYSMLLSFGEAVEVHEPEHVRRNLMERHKKAWMEMAERESALTSI